MTTSPDPGWAPEACTLPAVERPLRVAEFTSLFATSLRSLERIDDTHLRTTLAADVGGVRDLTARETECCSFFTFTVTEAADGIQLDIAVPVRYADVLDRLARHAAIAAGLPT
jgi:hypothetical protein